MVLQATLQVAVRVVLGAGLVSASSVPVGGIPLRPRDAVELRDFAKLACQAPDPHRTPHGIPMPRPTALLLLAALALPAQAAEPLKGHAAVIDGDTIELLGKRIDLYGIDAPEAAQTCETARGRSYRCGQTAANALRERIGTADVTCEPWGADAQGRLSALCRAGGEDLAAWMAANGHALANRRQAQAPAYMAQERRAWATRRGLWAGTFSEPADWRQARHRAEAAARPAPDAQ